MGRMLPYIHPTLPICLHISWPLMLQPHASHPLQKHIRSGVVRLLALAVQVGGFVPAESLTLTPVDAIFVRMGAKVGPATRCPPLCEAWFCSSRGDRA